MTRSKDRREPEIIHPDDKARKVISALHRMVLLRCEELDRLVQYRNRIAPVVRDDAARTLWQLASILNAYGDQIYTAPTVTAPAVEDRASS